MVGSSFSRRLSEFIGVVLFASALIWLIALTTYAPADSRVVLQCRRPRHASQLCRSRRGVSGRGFVPVARVCASWSRRFWRSSDGIISGAGASTRCYTKLVGATLLFTCFASFLSLAFVRVDIAGTTMLAGGSAGAWLAGWLAEYLNRTGSIIFI